VKTASTRDTIVTLATDLVRDKGFNAFSFQDISRLVGIKTASIHYYFPTKADLALAVLASQTEFLDEQIQDASEETPLEELLSFFSIYDDICTRNQVCIVGSMATDLHTLEPQVAAALKLFTDKVLDWVTEILAKGRQQGIFQFDITPEHQAQIIVTSMMASVQLARLQGPATLQNIKDSIIKSINPPTRK
jgi:AcrR family transcriptional regulator